MAPEIVCCSKVFGYAEVDRRSRRAFSGTDSARQLDGQTEAGHFYRFTTLGWGTEWHGRMDILERVAGGATASLRDPE